MIVLVTGPDGQKRLGRSKSKNAAIQAVVAEQYTARPVNADELVDLMDQGLKVEDFMGAEEVASDEAETSPQTVAVNG